MADETPKLGAREFQPNPSSFVAQELIEQGAEIAFGVQGGHIWQLSDEMSRHGIQMITVRHEQNAVYMAENWARIRRRPALVYATAGPGMTNTVTAVNQAYLAKAPMILLLGGHETEHDGLYTTIQEAYARDLLGGVTKWTQRIMQVNQIKQFIARAYKDAMSYPYAPIALELCANMLAFNLTPADQRTWEPGFPNADYVSKWRGDRTGTGFSIGGDPDLVAQTVELIYKAKNPLIFAGDGVHWSDAAKELKDFAEYAQVPVAGRRTGRGALPETHDLAMLSKGVAAIQKQVDLVVLVGMKVGFFDGYGGGWKRVIQINESLDHIWTFLPTEVELVGTPRVVLRQMLQYAQSKGLTPPSERKDWVRKARETSKAHTARLHEKAMKYADMKPLHPGYIAKVCADVVEDRYQGRNHIVVDGYTVSGFAPQMFTLRRSAQMTDASEQAGVGHGIGMAMGAAFAEPSTATAPVLSLMGDAGMGNAGMEIETAVRYNQPIVFLVTNNNGWLSGMEAMIYGEGWKALKYEKNLKWGTGSFIPDQRYDKMFEVIGCHGEWVTDPKDLKAALNRSFDAAEKGTPAVLNVQMTRRVAPTVTHTVPAYALCWDHIPWEDLAKRGKAMRAAYLKGAHPSLPDMVLPDPWEPISDDEANA